MSTFSFVDSNVWQEFLHLPETNGQFAPETRPKPRAPKGNDRKSLPIIHFYGKKQTRWLRFREGFFLLFRKNMMRCQTPTSHAGLVRSLTCSIQDSISVFFVNSRRFGKLTKKKLRFNRWMASGKRPPKKVSLFQPGFKSSDLLVLY